jgi:hypothetical protein
VAGRNNLRVQTNSLVSKILWENATASGVVVAKGVEYLQNGTAFDVVSVSQ